MLRRSVSGEDTSAAGNSQRYEWTWQLRLTSGRGGTSIDVGRLAITGFCVEAAQQPSGLE